MKSFLPMKVWNFAVYGHVHVIICMMCYISASMKTRANVFLFVVSIISFVFVFKIFFFFVFLTFLISKIGLTFIT